MDDFFIRFNDLLVKAGLENEANDSEFISYLERTLPNVIVHAIRFNFINEIKSRKRGIDQQ